MLSHPFVNASIQVTLDAQTTGIEMRLWKVLRIYPAPPFALIRFHIFQLSKIFISKQNNGNIMLPFFTKGLQIIRNRNNARISYVQIGFFFDFAYRVRFKGIPRF